MPVFSATAIQISGVKTPSMSSVTIDCFTAAKLFRRTDQCPDRAAFGPNSFTLQPFSRSISCFNSLMLSTLQRFDGPKFRASPLTLDDAAGDGTVTLDMATEAPAPPKKMNLRRPDIMAAVQA